MFTIDLHSADSFEIDGRKITYKQGERESRYVLPSGARISLWRGKGRRGSLEIGGYKTVTVRVQGSLDDLEPLFEFLS